MVCTITNKPLQLWLSCQGSPGAVSKLYLDGGIGAVKKALQTLSEKPRYGARYPEPREEVRDLPQAPDPGRVPAPRIKYVRCNGERGV
jgi:hypothetical protein